LDLNLKIKYHRSLTVFSSYFYFLYFLLPCVRVLLGSLLSPFASWACGGPRWLLFFCSIPLFVSRIRSLRLVVLRCWFHWLLLFFFGFSQCVCFASGLPWLVGTLDHCVTGVGQLKESGCSFFVSIFLTLFFLLQSFSMCPPVDQSSSRFFPS